LAEPVEAAAHAGVEAQRAGLEDEAAEQVRVDALRRLDLAAGSFLDLADHVARLLLGELDRGRQLDVEDALGLGDQPVELARDLLDLAGAVLLGKQQEEVANELLVAAQQLLERRRLGAVVDLRVAEEPSQLRTWRCASTKSPSSSRTGSSLSASLAASKRARAYMRCATAI
jgi:hypothetical protein